MDDLFIEALVQKLRGPLAPYFPAIDDNRDLGRGAANPTSANVPGGLQDKDRFFRTDLGWPIIYDAPNTRWLTTFEIAHPLKINDASAPTTYSAAGNTITVQSAIRTDYALLITRVSAVAVVAATNNATNYWTLTFRALQADGSNVVTIHAFDTKTFVAGTPAGNDAAPSTTSTLTGKAYIDVVATKTLAPGALTYWSTIHYKYIVP